MANSDDKKPGTATSDPNASRDADPPVTGAGADGDKPPADTSTKTDPSSLDSKAGGEGADNKDGVDPSPPPEDVEIDSDAETSRLYRRAVYEFDPAEREPQLAEHWVYADREIDEHGYF